MQLKRSAVLWIVVPRCNTLEHKPGSPKNGHNREELLENA